MAERSATAPHWPGLALILWILVRLIPATGRHRKPAALGRNPATCEDANRQVCSTATPNPAFTASRIRPYWTAREKAVRWKRRRILVMATHFRLDLDTRDIHTAPVGGGIR